jgi:pyrimidine-nucleoside phosphorylase
MSVPRAPLELLERTWRGEPVGADSVRSFVRTWLANGVTDAQMAAWCSIAHARGLDRASTHGLTSALIGSGERLDLASLGSTGDLHSTGGVGDNVTLVAVPVAAAIGVRVAKMSRRGLGYWGGTIDKLEAIPGYRTNIDLAGFVGQVQRVGCAVISQTPRLVPADARLSALREQTATIESPALIAASVMSKALAGGAQAVALEVTWGDGAACATLEQAQQTAELMSWLAERWSRNIRTVVSAIDQPLGRMVGNALEVREAADVLRGGGPADLRQIALRVAGELAEAAGVVPPGEGLRRASQALADGQALHTAERWVEAQGGNAGVWTQPHVLATAPLGLPVLASADGVVTAIGARAVGEAVRTLGAGRLHPTQSVDYAVGLELLAKVGDPVVAGEPIAMVHARDAWLGEGCVAAIASAVTIGDQLPTGPAARAGAA